MISQPGKNNPQVRWIRFRLILVALGLLIGFSLLLARSVQVQYFQRENWKKIAKRQVLRNLRLEPRRGDIYDRNGQKLAVSIEMDSLAANPRVIENPAATARQLSAILQVPTANLRVKLQQPRAFVWLKNYLSPRQVDSIRKLSLSGIHFAKEYRRYYPNKELAGHVLGFVGRDRHGLEGLELSEDFLLRGHPGTHSGAKDARGQIIYTHGLPARSDSQGYSLQLTLDKHIQYIAERELQETVARHEAESGVVVVLEPKSGEILAVAVSPAFNPNSFPFYGASIWRNRAVTDAFEPGSTFKIFLLAAALEEGLVHPNDIFYCEQGKYRISKHTIHDLRKHGWLSLAHILRLSSNIGAAKVGEKLGAARFYHYIRAFGFGTPTVIGLPGETSGLIRSPEKWSTLDLAAASFGQSVSVSALQLAMALGAVANDGLLMQPLLVKEVLDPEGKVLRRNKSRTVRRVISVATAQRLKKLLADVLKPGGTGTGAALTQYQAAGKTGTAQKSNRQKGGYYEDRYTASFAGFAPVTNPKILVVVVINEPKKGFYGGVVAAPAFRRIAQKTLHTLQAPPEKIQNMARSAVILDSTKPPEKQSFSALRSVSYIRTEGERSTGMPDLTGLSLRAALDQLRNFDCSPDIQGSGRVVGQNPGPGRDIKTVDSCSLILDAD